MNCECIRETLRQRFDDGRPLDEGLESHLDSCTRCRTYLSRLQALEGALGNMPLEESAPWLTERVRERISASAPLRLYTVVAVAVVLVVTAGVVGWFYPVTVNVKTWLEQAGPWLPRIEWDEAGSFLVAQVLTLRDQAASLLAGSLHLSSSTLLAAMAVAALFLAAFNGFEAVRLRVAGNDVPEE